MAMFKFTFSGGGITEAVARGERLTPELFIDALRFTPEPLLAQPDQAALVRFLRTTPASRRERSKTQRNEAERLLRLICESEANALTSEALAHLCAHLRGDKVRSAGAPILSMAQRADAQGESVLAACLEQAVSEALSDPSAPSLIRPFIREKPGWSSMPRAERTIRIVHAILRKWGHYPPSPRTLRNRISRVRHGYPDYS